MIDSTTLKFIGMLQTKMNDEPAYPNPEHFEGTTLEVVARTRLQWEDEVRGLRALLGVRLIDMALEEYR